MKNKKLYLCLILSLIISISNGQDTMRLSPNYSIRYTFYYNFKVAHHITVMSLEYKNHNLYLGPQYTYLFPPTLPENYIYENNTFGLNIGYRYYFNNQKKKIRFFSQLNFSIYRVKFTEWLRFYPFSKIYKKIVIENTGTLGLDYKIYKKIYIYAGGGIGSNNGFFLMFDAFLPSSYFGLEYIF